MKSTKSGGDGDLSCAAAAAPAPAVPTPVGDHFPRQKLSCDACRLRKVGCDRLNPCTRCERLGITCTYTLGYKSRPKQAAKTLQADSRNLEAKIDHLNDRLNKLCIFLGESAGDTQRAANLLSNHSHIRAHGTVAEQDENVSPWQTSQHDNDADYAPNSDDDDSQYRETLSLSAHADFATQVIESALQDDLGSCQSAEAQTILQNVRSRKHALTRSIRPADKPSPLGYHSMGDVETPASRPHLNTHDPRDLPPVQLTLKCLRMLKDTPSMQQLWFMSFDTVDQVTTHLLGLYPMPMAPTTPELVITYIGLHALLVSCARTSSSDEMKIQCLEQAVKCSRYAEVALGQLSFHLPTTVDCVLALTMATDYCISQCKTVTAWNYISVASRMSKTLGLHRVACESFLSQALDSENRKKSKLFWSVYTMDNLLALQLGRSSTFDDHDLAVPLRQVRLGYEWGSSLGILSSKTLLLAQLNGRVYRGLYSPRASTIDRNEKSERAQKLLAELRQIENEDGHPHMQFKQVRRKALGNKLDDLLTRSERLHILSFVCLIQRSVTMGTTSLSADCISTARQALKEYSETITLDNIGDVFMFDLCAHWALASVTSVPFFVVLCSAVWTLQQEDLDLVIAFVGALATADDEQSPIASHLLKRLKPLHDAAVHYFELKGSISSIAAANSTGYNPVTFVDILGNMAQSIDQEVFPMQWQALPLAPVGHESCTMESSGEGYEEYTGNWPG